MAYLLFNNNKVDWRAILSVLTDVSNARMAEHEFALCIQNTTEFDFNGQKTSGLE